MGHPAAEAVTPLRSNRVAEIKLRAERRMGELLREMPKLSGARGIGKKVELHDETPLLADIGIDKATSSRVQAIAAAPSPRVRGKPWTCSA